MISSIQGINVQGHKFFDLKLPKTGVVRIYGANSAGKTAMFKPLEDLLNGRIPITAERKDLVNDDAQEAIYTIETYNGYTFSMTLSKEASKTSYKLIRPSGEEVERYLSDKVMTRLFKELGFHYDEKAEQSLNLNRKDSPKLISGTSPKFNGNLIKSAFTDLDAEVALINYKNILDEAKEELRDMEILLGSKTLLLQNMTDTMDIEFEESRMKKLKTYSNLLNLLQIPDSSSCLPPFDYNEELLQTKVPSPSSCQPPFTFNTNLISLEVPQEVLIEVCTLWDFDLSLAQLSLPELSTLTLPKRVNSKMFGWNIPNPTSISIPLEFNTSLLALPSPTNLSIIIPPEFDPILLGVNIPSFYFDITSSLTSQDSNTGSASSLVSSLRRIHKLEASLLEKRCPMCEQRITEPYSTEDILY